MTMTNIYTNRLKTLWEKEKLLITSNFSFSRSVFKRLVLRTCKNQGLFGKGLNDPMKKAFEKIFRKGETACTHHFILFQKCFQSVKTQISTFERRSFCHLLLLTYFYWYKIISKSDQQFQRRRFFKNFFKFV